MWDRNLGLNRKITKVISENLNDTNSEIYKEISDISGEYTESNDIAKMIENGKDSITSFVNEDITELGNYAFKDCVNLEYVYLPNCTKLGKDCFQNCTSLKTLLLPNVTQIDTASDDPINFLYKLSGLNNLEVIDLSSYDSNRFNRQFDCYDGISIIFEQSKFPKLRILSYGINGLPNGGRAFGWNDLEILVLPNLVHLGHSAGFTAENIIIPNRLVSNAGSGYLTGKLYVNDDILSEYQNHENWHFKYDRGQILPISQLPQEIREELELCQIQI